MEKLLELMRFKSLLSCSSWSLGQSQEALEAHHKGRFSTPQPTGSETLGVGPAICALTSPPGDSDVHQSLKTSDLWVSPPGLYIFLVAISWRNMAIVL